MRNAAKVLIVGIAAAALAACNGKSQSDAAANQDLSVDDNISPSGLPANAEIETLPPDESSVTSNGELDTGQDNPDVNGVGNSQ